MNLPIPYPDPMPLPAPVWLLRTLLLLTFFLHVLFMNCLLGGTAVALVCTVRRKSSAFPCGWRRSRTSPALGFSLLPSPWRGAVAVSAGDVWTILYASSILIGVPWLAIIGMSFSRTTRLLLLHESIHDEQHEKKADDVVLALVCCCLLHCFRLQQQLHPDAGARRGSTFITAMAAAGTELVELRLCRATFILC